MTTIATLFSGFGGVDIGAMQAGLTPLWSIEYDAAIAKVAASNFGHRIHVGDILECDPHDFERVDVLHASPPCPNFSVANTASSETELDIALAAKVVEFIAVLQPSIFTLENVWAYRQSSSWQRINDALWELGYWVAVDHVNAADHGVPQTRKRMIVRAIKGGFVPYLPEPVRWVSWYEAIEDILHTLPESQFAPWQMARMPELMRSFLMQVQGEAGDGVRWDTEPMQTVTVAHGAAKYRAFIVPGGNDSFPQRDDSEHGFTIVAGHGGGGCRAWLVNESSTMEVRAADGSSAAQVASYRNTGQRGLIGDGHVVAMTPRALARFQSFPDWYQLPSNARLAAKGIGNAVPPLLYQRVIESLEPQP